MLCVLRTLGLIPSITKEEKEEGEGRKEGRKEGKGRKEGRIEKKRITGKDLEKVCCSAVERREEKGKDQ
jgi:hypothetical protein